MLSQFSECWSDKLDPWHAVQAKAIGLRLAPNLEPLPTAAPQEENRAVF